MSQVKTIQDEDLPAWLPRLALHGGPRFLQIADALQAAAADERFRGLDLGSAAVGIFGRAAPRDQPLEDGDRVEIYRPLLEEPKQARRKRAHPQASRSGRS